MLDHIMVKMCLRSLCGLPVTKKRHAKIRNTHFIVRLLMLIFQYDFVSNIEAFIVVPIYKYIVIIPSVSLKCRCKVIFIILF